MKLQIQSIKIRRFKAIDSASFDLGDVNVLVGANNAGKSSIIQALHFAVALLQTIKLGGMWKPKTQTKQISTSLNPAQLIYSPSEEVSSLALGGNLLTSAEKAIEFEFVQTDGSKFKVAVKKGKNRNISVSIDNAVAAESIASIDSPFSVFSPGLAGISKSENYVSDGVLL